MSAIKYRPDIDRPRVVTVFAVVLFHAGFSSLDDGFVGDSNKLNVKFVVLGYSHA